MTDFNAQLVGDLARIAGKYPPEEWEALLRILEDPHARGRVTTLLTELMTASRSRVRATPTGTDRMRSTLEELRVAEPERAETLNQIWNGLRQKDLAPTMASLRAFAAAVGMKESLASRRDLAVNQVVQYLIATPATELERVVELSENSELGSMGDFQSWFELILDKPRAGEAAPGQQETT